MLFNQNEFLMALSFSLDFVAIDIFGAKANHGKGVAYISLWLGKELKLSPEKLHDLVALALLHDNGASEKSLHERFAEGEEITLNSIENFNEHCIIGEENIKQYPFLTEVKNILLYHHEKYDGTGFFGLKGKDIPLMSQMIQIADTLNVTFDLHNWNNEMKENILLFVSAGRNKVFSDEIVHAFLNIVKNEKFWDVFRNDLLKEYITEETPEYIKDLSFEEIRNITEVFTNIIDSKSQYTHRHSSDLSKKVEIMADYYKRDYEEKMKLIIAANLHDIGKLGVPNTILDSPNKLSEREFEIVKKHPYYTRLALQEITGFEDITEWAANHHEKLNGKGYPFGKTGKELDFNSRLMGCLDMYEALTEERPYRKALTHKEAMEILNTLKNKGFIDEKITEDIDLVFSA